MSKRLGLSAIAVLASVLACGTGAMASTAQITASINDNQLVTLGHNTRPEAKNPANDRGAVSTGRIMEVELLLRRSPANEAAFEKALAGLSDPKSPTFHHWMSNQKIASYGVGDADIAKIGSWLTKQGLNVKGFSPDHTFITFKGTAGNIETAFHTEIHNLDVKGHAHFANMSDPKIPAALAPAVVGPVALHNFTGHPDFVKKHAPVTGYKSTNGVFYLMPEDLQTIYNFKPLLQSGITGKGQTIVLIEDTDVYKMADWNVFRAVGGLSGYRDATFTQVHPTGATSCADPKAAGNAEDAEDEAILDVEWASAAAPDANVQIASCADSTTDETVTGFGGLIALQNILASGNVPTIVSMSYGECETATGSAGNAAFNSAYQSLTAHGGTIFVSSGDEDSDSCDALEGSGGGKTYYVYFSGIGVSGWTSSPYDVSVGGTDFGTYYANCRTAAYPGCMSAYWTTSNDKVYGTAKSYMPEIPWNNSCASQLVATLKGYTTTYGTAGFCNSTAAHGTTINNTYEDNVGGSGGPSGCATGDVDPNAADPYAVGNTCAGYAKPAYQAGFAGIVNDGVRDIPDVSMFASNGFWESYYAVCDSDPAINGTNVPGCNSPNPANWAGFGGTSISTPIVAGIQALINQKTGQSWGQDNAQFYTLARNEYGATGNSNCNSSLGNGVSSSCVYYDVTQGDIDVPCNFAFQIKSSGAISNFSTSQAVFGASGPNCYVPSGTIGVLSTSTTAYQPAYGTTTGYDLATGIGTINASNLVNAWQAAFSSTPSAPKLVK